MPDQSPNGSLAFADSSNAGPTAKTPLTDGDTLLASHLKGQRQTLGFFVAGRSATGTRAALLLRTAASKTVKKVSTSIDGTVSEGTVASDFAVDPTKGALWSSDVGTVFGSVLFANHIVSITHAAADARRTTVSAAIDTTKLLDILLDVKYTSEGS